MDPNRKSVTTHWFCRRRPLPWRWLQSGSLVTPRTSLLPVATFLFLWAIPIALSIMLALVPSIWPAIRVFSLVSAVVLMWVAWALHGAQWLAARLVEQNGAETLSRLGVTGDLFGGINALFAAFAFGGVAIAAYLQFKTNRQARIQSFEGAFFSAVELLHRIAEGLTFDESLLNDREFDLELARLRKYAGIVGVSGSGLEPVLVFKGREVFSAVVAKIAQRASTPEKVIEEYRVLQVHHNYVLGHYFRHLYQVLKLIDRQPSEVLEASDKDGYASLLRAQLSTSELALLLLNCTNGMVDQGQFRNLLVKYRMLEHLPYFCEAGYFKTRQSGLVLGDLRTMQCFLTIEQIVSVQQVSRGAFGSNPEVVPKP
jgi:hypothetical protein